MSDPETIIMQQAKIIEQLKNDNRQLKHALGHTEAALDNWGDGTLGELRSTCQKQAETIEQLKKELKQ